MADDDQARVNMAFTADDVEDNTQEKGPEEEEGEDTVTEKKEAESPPLKDKKSGTDEIVLLDEETDKKVAEGAEEATEQEDETDKTIEEQDDKDDKAAVDFSKDDKDSDTQKDEKTQDEVSDAALDISSQPDHGPSLSIWDSMLRYSSSAKGRALTMGTSVTFAMLMSVICLAMLFTQELSPIVSPDETLGFFIFFYLLSFLCAGALLLLGAFGRLTSDNHYRNMRKMNFIRGGMLLLGTGGLIYRGSEVAEYGLSPSGCVTDITLVSALMGIFFTVAQISFLFNYAKVKINRTLALGVIGRFLVMSIIGTNICVWLLAIFTESMHEMHVMEEKENVTPVTALQTGNGTLDCGGSSQLVALLTPYTFPFMIEFCVMASTMGLAIWEKCGQEKLGDGPDVDGESFATTTIRTDPDGSVESDMFEQLPSKFYNTNVGFVIGWLIILAAVITIIVSLFLLYSDSKGGNLIEQMSYIANVLLCIAVIIGIPITMRSMMTLTFKDEEIKILRGINPHAKLGIHRELDKNLLFFTMIAMVTFKMLSIIAAYQEQDEVIFADGIICIIMGIMQTTFLNFYASQKRSTTEEHRLNKPGRQGLEFIRCTNFALWLVNSFLLKHTGAKTVMYKTFGTTAWAILSNVFQPLTILYYFHSVVCAAEVIVHSYSAKYVGIMRLSKMKGGPFTASFRSDARSSFKSDALRASVKSTGSEPLRKQYTGQRRSADPILLAVEPL